MQKEQIDPNNPMNNSEVREKILSRLSESERDELLEMGFEGSTSSENYYKFTKIKNEVFQEVFPGKYNNPSDLNQMN